MFGDPKAMRKLARDMQKLARIQEMASMSPEQAMQKMMKEQMTKVKRKARRDLNKKIMKPFT